MYRQQTHLAAWSVHTMMLHAPDRNASRFPSLSLLVSSLWYSRHSSPSLRSTRANAATFSAVLANTIVFSIDVGGGSSRLCVGSMKSSTDCNNDASSGDLVGTPTDVALEDAGAGEVVVGEFDVIAVMSASILSTDSSWELLNYAQQISTSLRLLQNRWTRWRNHFTCTNACLILGWCLCIYSFAIFTA